MILKAKERGDGKQLGQYLLRTDTNEHIELHELRGFVSSDPALALGEIDAISRGTRARKPLFSLSLNPPPSVRVSTDVFESAIERIEQRLGLSGQPRMVVFHEKDGRRHAHAVWSRIDTQEMKAINLSHYKLKLRDIGRELFLENGWKMPRGFVTWKERNPWNMSREEWQQAMRTEHDPEALKRMFKECWAISDSRSAFAQALKSRGYTLAIGDRRGHVAVDYRGKVYSISKYTDHRTKQVNARLGDPAAKDAGPKIATVLEENAKRMSALLKSHIEQAERANRQRSAALKFQYTQTVQRQREEREKLRQAHELRWNAENDMRAARLSKGFRGIWDRLTGRHGETKRQNERETLLALRRDREEMDGLVFRHIEERSPLQQRIRDERKSAALDMQRLRRDIANYMERGEKLPPVRDHFGRATGQRKDFSRSRDRDFEPEI